jgi:hypothetical protein
MDIGGISDEQILMCFLSISLGILEQIMYVGTASILGRTV